MSYDPHFRNNFNILIFCTKIFLILCFIKSLAAENSAAYCSLETAIQCFKSELLDK